MADASFIRFYNVTASPYLMHGVAVIDDLLFGGDYSSQLTKWAIGNGTVLQTLTWWSRFKGAFRVAAGLLYTGDAGFAVSVRSPLNLSAVYTYTFYAGNTFMSTVLSATSIFYGGGNSTFEEQSLANGSALRFYIGHTSTYVNQLELQGALIFSGGFNDFTGRRWSTTNATLLTTYTSSSMNIWFATALNGMVVIASLDGPSLEQFNEQTGVLQKTYNGVSAGCG